MPMKIQPCPLIGPIRSVCEEIAEDPGEMLKILLSGPPGVGKTAGCEWIAAAIGASKWDIDSINGRNLTIGTVRDWLLDIPCSSMYGTWRVKIINELDTTPKDAQDALLSLLDELPPMRAVLATSNMELGDITERFRTRFLRYNIRPPSEAEITQLLISKGAYPDAARLIASTCSGNVRQALLDVTAIQRSEKRQQRAKQSALTLVEGFA